jgi:hypothetical protein
MTTGRHLRRVVVDHLHRTTTTMMARPRRPGLALTEAREQAHHPVGPFAFCADCGAGVAAFLEPFGYH